MSTQRCHRRAAIKRAAQSAGLTVLRVMTFSSAVALSYAQALTVGGWVRV